MPLHFSIKGIVNPRTFLRNIRPSPSLVDNYYGWLASLRLIIAVILYQVYGWRPRCLVGRTGSAVGKPDRLDGFLPAGENGARVPPIPQNEVNARRRQTLRSPTLPENEARRLACGSGVGLAMAGLRS